MLARAPLTSVYCRFRAMKKRATPKESRRDDDVVASPEMHKDAADDDLVSHLCYFLVFIFARNPSNVMSTPITLQQSATTSFVSGSSVWTDTSGAQDRGSRRALILQMAKARMKSNKLTPREGQAPIAEEPSIAESSEYHEDDVSKSTAPTKLSDMNLANELD